MDVEEPVDFAVNSDKITYKAGDTAIFGFAGKADLITFFSGEIGRRYENRNRRIAAGIPRLSFQTNMTQGVLTNPDSIRLYITAYLRGYDSTNVVNASWVDITNRNTKWPVALTTTFTNSDTINLSDFNNADSINIAFRVMNKQYLTAAQRRWQLQNLVLTNTLPDGRVTNLFSTFSNAGWVQANIKNNPAPKTTVTNFHAWNVGQAGISASNATFIISGRPCNSNGIPIQTAYPITFDPSTSTNQEENDDWLITSAVNLKTTNPDVGAGIKRATDATLKTYRYRFATPGTYVVTFLAQNQGLNVVKEVVRQITITVTP
ncbi:MAG: DUF5017 domain-containing protein [Chitinophagaceae bacterium]